MKHKLVAFPTPEDFQTWFKGRTIALGRNPTSRETFEWFMGTSFKTLIVDTDLPLRGQMHPGMKLSKTEEETYFALGVVELGKVEME